MKKYAILLLAGATIGLASCGGNENTSTTEQIDSMATYRTDTMEAALRAQNDSLINELARMRADSAMRAQGMSTTKTTTTVTRPANTSRVVKPATTTTTKSNGRTTDGRLNVDDNKNDGRLNVDKNTDSKDKTKTNDGRLKID